MSKDIKSAFGPFDKPYEDFETGIHRDGDWCGVPGVKFIWHGEWGSPELEYEGVRVYVEDVYDRIYDYMKDDGLDAENRDEFAKFCQDNVYLVYECFDDFGEIESSKKENNTMKKPVKSSEDKEKYWGAFGENGCVDFLTREEFIEKFGEEPKDEDALDYVDSGCHGKDKKDKKKKPVQSMARGYLQPQYDSRASFYNKAEFDDDKLYSYGTLVAEIVDGKPVLYPDWDYSQTTIRHVREFLRQHGFTADSKAQIAKDYLTNARKPVKSSMSVEELPREALQELKQRYYAEKYDKDLSYDELADIDNIVSDEEVFDEYGGTLFTEDDFFCLANSRKPVKSSVNNDRVYSYGFDYIITKGDSVDDVENRILNEIQLIDGIEVVGNPGINNTSWSKEEYGITSSMQGRERGIQAIMDEYGCTREEAIEIMNEEIQNSRKPIKSSLVNGISDEELKLLCKYADQAFEDINWLYDNDPDTLAEHDYDQSELDDAQRIAQRLYDMLSKGI